MKKHIQLRRIPREYKSNFVKYGILHLFLITIIAVISGYLTGAEGFNNSYHETLETYNVSDGKFITYYDLDDTTKDEIETKYDLTIYPQWYCESFSRVEGEEETLYRAYQNREIVNKPALVEGRLPETEYEIAIENNFAKVNNAKIGDEIKLTNEVDFVVSGFICFPDYNALYKNANDVAVQNKIFCPCFVTDEGFLRFDEDTVECEYAYKFNKQLTLDEKKAINYELKSYIQESVLDLNVIGHVNFLYDFSPSYLNRAVTSGDGFSLQYNKFVLLFNYIVVAVIAFVFGITTLSHINDEAKTIGTLRATGYSKMSLVLLNLILPAFITLVSAALGNIIGYFALGMYFTTMYSTMFSLPAIHLTFIPKVFLLTTLIPTAIMILVNFILIYRKLSFPTLKFLKGDLSKDKQNKAIKLNEKSSFESRFRKRIILQNIPNYIVIIIGILMGTILFSIGTVYKKSVDNQLQLVAEKQISENQYILTIPFPLKDKPVEEFSFYSFSFAKPHYLETKIQAYGVINNSEYIDLDFEGTDGIFVSSAFQKKFNTKIGEQLEFNDISKNINYTYEVAGIYEYDLSPAIFMPIEKLNSVIIGENINKYIDTGKKVAEELGFEIPENFHFFNAYFSNEEVEIPEIVVLTIVNKSNMVTEAKRISKAGSGISIILIALGAGIDILLMFLLTKQIIEKNQKSISMCKILGFESEEIAKLYIVATTIVVVLGLLFSLPFIYGSNLLFFKTVIYPGSVTFVDMVIPWYVYLVAFGAGLASYLVTTFIQMKHIKKISMVQALKEQ